MITEYIIGYLYPGYPVANMCFKVYGYISVKQGIAFLHDFKLGHYMKIPPRSMFMAQVPSPHLFIINFYLEQLTHTHYSTPKSTLLINVIRYAGH